MSSHGEPEEPEVWLGPGRLAPSVMTAGQGLGPWPLEHRQLRPALSAGPQHCREDPDRMDRMLLGRTLAVVKSPNCVPLFGTPWTAARQAGQGTGLKMDLARAGP